ncbi:hypothetical protein [Herpetosiphon gulosus]|uniref:hypothetical protein n=1 Tax=Herpetosiphon gulosus TaxID=1973496 RepID=UPI0031EBE899
MSIAILLRRQNGLALLVNGAGIGDAKVGSLHGRAKIRKDILKVILHRWQSEGEKALLRFEIAQLENKPSMQEIIR